MHKDGHGGLVVDFDEAVRLRKLAAAQGLADAQFDLGVCYRDGRGVPLDLAEAARLFRLAADQGHASAQGALAVAYIRGDGFWIYGQKQITQYFYI
jgi:TPR repeat protein